MKSSPIRLKQKLSPEARKRKAARDLAYAKTPARRRKKRENQKTKTTKSRKAKAARG